ncbi:PP2C family serine/threonine-protein phosphatase [Desulfotomaculum sp. 1211_IL3151]|uniref:PP2C family serine/threonine-protein phosphatase n=1 Tax=Desulfotomaculum sp. 1211_IL3151 TaxID=3084055 RepID=UPI002FDB8638
MDLKKHFKDSVKLEEIRNLLVKKLDFSILESKDSIIIQAKDPEQQQLIDRFNAGQIDMNQFLVEAKKKFTCHDHSVRIINKWGTTQGIMVGETTHPLRPIEVRINGIKLFLHPIKSNQEPESQVPQRPEEVTPQWKNLEPTDKEDWVEIEESGYQERKDGWAVAAASRRGKTHAHEGSHRDDSFDFGFQNGWSILAAADGAGSYRLSRVGAKMACSMAVEHLKAYLENFIIEENEGSAIPKESDLLQIKRFLIETVQRIIQSVKDEANKRSVTFDLLSTTILIAIHHHWQGKNMVASIQIGDGLIAIWHGGSNVSILGKADSGVFASETKFITTKGIENELEHKVFFAIKPAVDAIAVMTDGVSDDFFPPETIMPKMFESVYQELIGSAKPNENLLKWLSYERRGSFDDRTMVILHRR